MIMVRETKLCFMTVLFFVYNTRLGNSVDVDHKCANGQPLTVFWWSQEPYIYSSEKHSRKHRQADEEPDLSGMFPHILSIMLKRCCHSNATLNYTKIPEGPSHLDRVLTTYHFDVIIPVGTQVGASTVRLYPFAGILESPGIAVLIRGNVSGTQLLLSVLQAWPLLVFILITASIAGVLIWLMVGRIHTINDSQTRLSTFQSIYSNYGVLFKHDYILADVFMYKITQTE